jgi:hypothetical protein
MIHTSLIFLSIALAAPPEQAIPTAPPNVPWSIVLAYSTESETRTSIRNKGETTSKKGCSLRVLITYPNAKDSKHGTCELRIESVKISAANEADFEVNFSKDGPPGRDNDEWALLRDMVMQVRPGEDKGLATIKNYPEGLKALVDRLPVQSGIEATLLLSKERLASLATSCIFPYPNTVKKGKQPQLGEVLMPLDPFWDLKLSGTSTIEELNGKFIKVRKTVNLQVARSDPKNSPDAMPDRHLRLKQTKDGYQRTYDRQSGYLIELDDQSEFEMEFKDNVANEACTTFIRSKNKMHGEKIR